jgi:prepilin-type N-terminal cleavage/methylation domain-containing protein
MVKNNRGVTLVELIIAMVIAAFVLVAGIQFISYSTRTLTDFSIKNDRGKNFASLSGHLKKYMPTGGMRFMAFTGISETPLARLIIPQPGMCGDLKTNCPNDTSLLYVHYSKSQRENIAAICLMPSTASSPGLSIILDGANTTFGNVSQEYIFQKLTTNAIFALQNPPDSTLWVATGNPVRYDPNWTAQNHTFNDDFSKSGCASRLQTVPTSDNQINYVTDKLFRIEIKPLMLTQFTGRNSSFSEITDSVSLVGNFPMGVFPVDLHSLGRYPDSSGQGYVEIRTCSPQLSDAQNKLNCVEGNFAKLENVQQMRVDESYKIALSNSFNSQLETVHPERYEIVTPGMSTSLSCKLNDCAVLRVLNPLSIPYQATLASGQLEDSASLTDLQFSLLKNQFISAIRIRLLAPQGEQYFDVSF